MKKLLSLLLSLAMSICLVCALSAPAFAVVAEDVNASATTEVVVESTQPVSVLEPESETEPEGTATVEETDTTPLTPDGNSNLQDDSTSKNKEFITVQTKNGNYFYLIIDKDRADNNAYLLSQIDEGDLKAFLEEEEVEEVPQTIVPIAEESTEEKEEPEEQPKAQGGMNALTLLLLAAAGGGAFYYFKVLRPKQEQARGEERIQATEYEDDVLENEDDTRVAMSTIGPETGDEEVDE